MINTFLILLANSLLQQNLNKIEDFTSINMMKINEKKSNVMIFNKSKNYEFPPRFAVSNGDYLECVEETKLLGIILNSSHRFDSNTANMVTRAMSKMWLLRRMKLLNLEPDIIFD